jgi:hypothetical protein
MRAVTCTYVIAALCLSALVAMVATAQPLTDSPQAQALVDQALAIWADTRTQPVGERALQAKALLEQVVANYPDGDASCAAIARIGMVSRPGSSM